MFGVIMCLREKERMESIVVILSSGETFVAVVVHTYI